ncbi:MAG: hypothetical protein R3B96_24660 [Pirellulaceae bacterium]
MADHIHWNEAEAWSDIRNGVSNETNEAGGGHAHSGMLIWRLAGPESFHAGPAINCMAMNQPRLPGTARN